MDIYGKQKLTYEYDGKNKFIDGCEPKSGTRIEVRYIKMTEIDKYIKEGWEVCMEDFPLCPDGIGPANALVKRKCV